ncbi:ATP-dependent DNA helicase RecG [Ectobacillus sp. sgz5001026]|uniref:ATP-dependent DNA helicase RecG n=1 Tax=Ectobacillus sp. sgz5001026 TaxID=3242473 RepID=UPI0036D3F6EE
MKIAITQIKGIGEEMSQQLGEMGLYTVEDLLEHFPYRYEDYSMKDLEEVKHDEQVTVEGMIHSLPLLQYYGKKKSRLTFRLLVGRYLIQVVCFNRPYYKDKINMDEKITVSGKWDQHRQTIIASNVHFTKIERTIEPVYAVKGKVTVKQLRRFVIQAFKQFDVKDPLPEGLRARYKLLPRLEAMRILHMPLSHEDLKQARRRFVYEEFFLFQLKMQALRKIQRENAAGQTKYYSGAALQQFQNSLPFPLTNAQTRVVSEILNDLTSPYRMNRLLQGDVGSGKTVVAAISLYATVLAGFQGALMVPTEILAEQHVQSLKQLFVHTNVSIELLTSSVKGVRRRDILERLARGEVHILIGTHALIQDEVNFKCLGLVITDEQHRFGVAQRRVLREKGEQPDVLFMTATPIPRTLAITVFGEMDVSIIDEMPAGRKEIETYWAKHDMFERVVAFVEKEMQKGRQAYVITPLIEESEKLDVQNAIDLHSMLTHHLKQFQVGLMHGRLSAAEKEDAMRKFSTNEVQLLVSTTVVEVGVNVPNATVMVIYDADRFGLSQLHQLRGRVGRGSEQSYCILIADPKSEVGKERMRIMTETNDGFVLSEKDLELRGPGDFFGRKQSGLPDFKVADMVHDYKVLEIARDDAALLVETHAFWSSSVYADLRSYLDEVGVLQDEKLD